VVFGDVTPGVQTAQRLDTILTKNGQNLPIGVNYYVYLPEKYGTSNKKWPLLVFLHGIGEAGNDVTLLLRHGPTMLLQEPESYPFLSENFITISPQNPGRGHSWKLDTLFFLLHHISEKYAIDTTQIFLSGFCHGAEGCYAMCVEKPDYAATAAFISMYGFSVDTTKVCSLKSVPTRFHHGKLEHVPWNDAADLSEMINDCGGDSEFILDPEGTHDLHEKKVFSSPDIYNWFLSHRSAKPCQNDTLCLKRPYGNRNFPSGDTLQIEWEADTNEIKAVTLQISPNGGRNWYMFLPERAIYCDAPSWGHYEWTLPDSVEINRIHFSLHTDSCVIKVQEYGGSHKDETQLFSIDGKNPMQTPFAIPSHHHKMTLTGRLLHLQPSIISDGALYLTDLRGRCLVRKRYTQSKNIIVTLPSLPMGIYTLSWHHGATIKHILLPIHFRSGKMMR